MPRLMKDPAFREQQQQDTYAPHIAPINRMVDALRHRDGREWMPYVAPLHGGTGARVLSILRDPGPATQDGSGSGFICIENDDPTAERQAVLFEANDVPASAVTPWNAYPWYIDAAPSASQKQAGAAVLVQLVELLPELRVVLLQGRDAQDTWRRAVKLRPDIAHGATVIPTIHPGRQALFHADPAVRAARVQNQVDTFAEVARLLAV